MKIPETIKNEPERLHALLTYKILDSAPEKDFDDITKLASEICDMPISIITLVDENRQWFKSKIGLKQLETHRDISFCGHAIINPYENFIISNALEDERFTDNPLVTGELSIRSYVGVPLVDQNGFAFGTLCVIDNQVRNLEPEQIKALEKLANQTMRLLELKKLNYELTQSHNQLLDRYKELEQFSSIVSHDIKSPLNNIMLLSKLLKEEHASHLDNDGNLMVDYISQSAEQLKKLVDAILDYYRYDTIDLSKRNKIRFHEFSKYIIGLLNVTDDITFVLPDKKVRFYSNKMALGQILYNLIANAIKYNDKKIGTIEIGFSAIANENIIWIKDNGMGIPEKHFETIFEVFTTLGKTDRFHSNGTGMGLSTVKKMVEKLNGRLEVESIVKESTTFRIFLPK